MKQRSTSSSNKHILSRNAKLFTVRTTSDAFQTKEEKLFENKSFLEIILGLIKKTQNDVLTKKIFYNIKHNFSYTKVKNLLKDLKKDLIQINVEEKKKVNLNVMKMISIQIMINLCLNLMKPNQKKNYIN